MIQDHAAAVLAALAAATPALTVYDGQVPPQPKLPYVVVYFAFDRPEAAEDTQSSNLTGASRRADCMAYCHCVGTNAVAARILSGRVSAALLDLVVTVPGRSVFPIRLTDSQPAQRDESTGVLLFDQVDVYRLSTVPSA